MEENRRKDGRGDDALCGNIDCGKYQCWRHWVNHKAEPGTEDLNPEGLTRCPRYLSKFERRNEERRRNRLVWVAKQAWKLVSGVWVYKEEGGRP